MERRLLLTSAEAVSLGVAMAKPQVISAYPITPQTHIVEKLAAMVETGEIDATFIRVEAEISALAVVIGATAQGVRSFTATSSHGLLYMHELIHWCAGGRLPVVMAVANRAVGAPWNIWCDQQDMLSQRDTGWMMVFASNAQEAHDFPIIAYRVAEKVFLPAMVGIDGFILSHTAEPLTPAGEEEVNEFLPPLDIPLRLSIQDPFTLWPILEPSLYHRQRRDLFCDMERARDVWSEAFEEWGRITKRTYSPVEEYLLEDAQTAFVCMGAISETVKVAMDRLRSRGERVGVATVKVFRPFPKHHLMEIASRVSRFVVLDRGVSYGAEGILAQEVRSCISGARPVHSFVISMGGKEVLPENVEEAYAKTRRVTEDTVLWS